jgi:Protein of unknown function (DUF3037)
METINYQYQILRYRHDVATGEFVNVGLVYFDAETHFLRARMTKKKERIARFFGEIEGDHLLRTFKGLEDAFNRLENTHKFLSVREITNSVLPPNDNALTFSPTFKGIDFTDHNVAFDDLYHTLIGKYNGENTDEKDHKNKSAQQKPQLIGA